VREINLPASRLLLQLTWPRRQALGPIGDREPPYQTGSVSLLEEKLQSYGGKGEHWELLWESEEREAKFSRDPTEEM